jgi:hypothetical protein
MGFEESELELEKDAQRQLEAAGFFVSREVPHTAKGVRFRADLIAYGPDENGILRPEVLIEVKARDKSINRAALAQLSRYAVAFDTPRTYLFDGGWRAVDPTFSETRRTIAPAPARGSSIRPDVGLSLELLRPSIMRMLSRLKDASREESPELSVQTVREVLKAVAEDLSGWTDRHPEDRWSIARAVASELLDAHSRALQVPMSLAEGMANLLAAEPNWQVADPACGIGTLLLAVGDRGYRRDNPVLVAGDDRDVRLRGIAQELLGFAGLQLNPIEAGVRGDGSQGALQGGISFPPMGARRTERFRLPSGDWTRGDDMFALATLIAQVTPGGRVVFGTTQSFLSGSSLAAYRHYLSETFWVVAVIELPSRTFAATSIAPALIVIQRTAPGQTMVASLDEDWKQQLSDNGSFYKAYLSHLRSR